MEKQISKRKTHINESRVYKRSHQNPSSSKMFMMFLNLALFHCFISPHEHFGIVVYASERLIAGSCDSKAARQNSTLRQDLKQFFSWVRKRVSDCSAMSIKQYDQWRVWLQKSHKTRNQVRLASYHCYV